MVSSAALAKMHRIRNEIILSETLGYYTALQVLKKVSIRENTGWSFDAFYRAREDIKAFKLLTDQHGIRRYIANLIIPKGTLIHIGSASDLRVYYKCRAEKARVHSIVDRYTGNEVTKAYSIRVRPKTWGRMQYKTGKLIDLTLDFDHRPGTCAAGVHFFLDVKSALLYDAL
jgi:hypothetical protein